jgi:hypothetical protein
MLLSVHQVMKQGEYICHVAFAVGTSFTVSCHVSIES